VLDTVAGGFFSTCHFLGERGKGDSFVFFLVGLRICKNNIIIIIIIIPYILNHFILKRL